MFLATPKVVLSGCKKITGKGLTALCDGLPNLSKLEIDGCDLNCEDFYPSSKLQTINLQFSDVDNAVLTLIGQNCHDRRHINLYYSFNFSDDGLIALAQGRPLLEYISLSNATDLGGNESQFTDRALMSIARHCVHLKTIYMVGNDSENGLTETGLGILLAGCHELELLSLLHCPCFTDSVLAKLEYGHDALKYLLLNNCNNFSEQAILQLCKALSILRGKSGK